MPGPGGAHGGGGGGNHYSRSVAQLEQLLAKRLGELHLLRRANDDLRSREAALQQAASSIAGGLEATCHMLGDGGGASGPHASAPAISCSGERFSAAVSGNSSGATANTGCRSVGEPARSVSATASARAAGTLAHLAAAERQVQHKLEQLGVADGYDELYTTHLLRRATSDPARAAGHVAASTQQRLAFISAAVQKFGLLLPKYTNDVATSLGSARQQLDALVDEVCERVLTCGLLDLPQAALAEVMVNMDTGLPEPYPEGWWAMVVEALSLSAEQKGSLRVAWERVKSNKSALTAQLEALAARLAQLQKQQHDKQRQFENQAQEVYCAVHLQQQLERELQNEQPPLETQLERHLELELERELLGAATLARAQQQQQQQQQLRQLAGVAADERLCLDEDTSYGPVSAGDVAAAAVAALADGAPLAGLRQQQQQQQPNRSVFAAAAAMPLPDWGQPSPPWAGAGTARAASCSAPGAAAAARARAPAEARGCVSATAAPWPPGAVAVKQEPQLDDLETQRVPSVGSAASAALPPGAACRAFAPATAPSAPAALGAAGGGHPDFASLWTSLSGQLPAQQQAPGAPWGSFSSAGAPARAGSAACGGRAQLLSAADDGGGDAIVLPDDVEPQRAISFTLARSNTGGQRDLLVQVCGKEQADVELEMERVTSSLKGQALCMSLHVHNVCTRKQLAELYLSCYPFVPEAFSLCEALEDSGW